MRKLVIVLFIFSVALSTGCQKKPAAEVNGEKISEEMLARQVDARARQFQAQGTAVNAQDLRSSVLEQMIAETLILQGAREAGITVSDEEVAGHVGSLKGSMGEEAFNRSLQKDSLSIEEFSALMRDRAVKEKFALALVDESAVTEEEAKNFFGQNRVAFAEPASVQVRFIQVPTLDEANAVVDSLKKGKDSFDQAADRLQEQGKARVSGYGWTKPAVFSPEIKDALLSVKIGSYGGPYEGRGGYFIFRVKDRKEQRTRSFEEARDEIMAGLLRQKRSLALMQWVTERKNTADIVRY
jgi:peptidyl-prolyl cis-trans isomerase C